SKLVPQEVPPQAIIPSVNAQTNSTQAVSPKVVAAISAAVHQYRTATVK
ncbi:oxaloacetate decarboxylase subunit gamma, partial [Vibrio sp. FNV 38]|nr:oxaloacetate decarboxylase subunit gamma [Vibrio sp. FNV 38]